MLHYIVERYLTRNRRLTNPPLSFSLRSDMQTSELVLKLGKQGADYADVVVLLTDMP